jgi:hypothetical protein
MSDSILFTGGCCNSLTPKQLKSLREACVDDNIIDTARCIENLNSCGISIEELFNTYPIYNPQKGLYSSWGDIPFPWEIAESTLNLLLADTDDRWRVAKYREIVAYAEGTRVLRIEQDGYEVVLYETLEDVLAFPFAFDSTKWQKICSIKTTVPAGLPSLEDLYSRFLFYELDFFFRDWGEIDEEWEANFREQSLQTCLSENPTATFLELEKCLSDKSSDRWSQARVRKEYFYREGDIVLVNGECGDVVCVYIALQDMPATQEVFDEYKVFKLGEYWEKIYCISTGENKCLGPQRTKMPEEAYEFIEIGSREHYVESPIPYSLRPEQKDLDELIERRASKVLSQREIDVLDGTLPSDCLKS